jgi:uncharacterized membrane protein YqiK
MSEQVMTVLVAIGVGFVLLLSIGIMVARFYRQVAQGQVLIVNTMKNEPLVRFTGAVVLPIIHRAEVMDISLKTIIIDRRGKEGLICADNIRADIKVAFFVRVNKTVEDVLKVASAVGCERASHSATLSDLFEAKFSEALKTVGKRLNFEDLYKERDSFKDQIVQVIGKDLNGYHLEDAAIDFLEQTPVEMLDAENILDAQGIRKITELTSQQNVLTNDFRQTERKRITQQNVEADEAVFALERQRAEAAAKQKREIETVQAREQAETTKVQKEEMLKSEQARIRSEEEIAVLEQNKQRQTEVAEKNRERVVGIEAERVRKDRDLEAISREREVELQRIGKEKALEVERKAIADVKSTRIAVEKKVATEEESIQDVHVLAEAKRKKDAQVIAAEGLAMEDAVQRVKAAEAAEEVSRHEAKQRLIAAEASLEAADKEARAKMRLAEGTQAEAAAPGLAEAKVKEAQAAANEKVGLSQAHVAREQLGAEAAGAEAKGLALAKVQEAEAAALLKLGEAQANVARSKALAEAAGVQEKLLAEARGLTEKAESMKLLQGATREHEEFRLNLEKDKAIELAALDVKKHIAEHQARTMSEAFGKAKINIVGGDGAFFDQFVKAVTLGQSVDASVEQSSTLQTVLKGYLNGSKDLPEDVKAILSKPALTALLAKMAKS